MLNRFIPGNKYVVIMGGDRSQDGLNGEYTLTQIDGATAIVTNSRGRVEKVYLENLYSHDELSRIMNEWWEPGY